MMNSIPLKEASFCNALVIFVYRKAMSLQDSLGHATFMESLALELVLWSLGLFVLWHRKMEISCDPISSVWAQTASIIESNSAYSVQLCPAQTEVNVISGIRGCAHAYQNSTSPFQPVKHNYSQHSSEQKHFWFYTISKFQEPFTMQGNFMGNRPIEMVCNKILLHQLSLVIFPSLVATLEI